MKIVVTSQNFRTITGHAGKGRRFLVFNEQGEEVERIDLPKEMSFHAWHGSGEHPLDQVDAMITAGCGGGFVQRMASRGIRLAITEMQAPREAVLAFVEGRLSETSPEEAQRLHDLDPHHHH